MRFTKAKLQAEFDRLSAASGGFEVFVEEKNEDMVIPTPDPMPEVKLDIVPEPVQVEELKQETIAEPIQETIAEPIQETIAEPIQEVKQETIEVKKHVYAKYIPYYVRGKTELTVLNLELDIEILEDHGFPLYRKTDEDYNKWSIGDSRPIRPTCKSVRISHGSLLLMWGLYFKKRGSPFTLKTMTKIGNGYNWGTYSMNMAQIDLIINEYPRHKSLQYSDVGCEVLRRVKNLATMKCYEEYVIDGNRWCSYERVNLNYLSYIVNNWGIFEPLLREKDKEENKNTKTLLAAYLAKADSETGLIKVSYKQRRGCGRYYAVGGLSLQGFPREIRHTIAREFYIDIDIKNAHPVILEHLCKKHGFACEQLSKYINNRDELLSQVVGNDGKPLPREDAKKIYLSLTNGGKRGFLQLDKPSEHMELYKKELIRIHSLFAKLDPAGFAKKKKRRIKAGKDYNHEASFMNDFLCKYENHCLKAMEYFGLRMQYATVNMDNVCNKDVNCFDGGLFIKRVGCEGELVDYKLDEMAKFVKRMEDIQVELAEKPMDQGFDMSKYDVPKYVFPNEKPITVEAMGSVIDEMFKDKMTPEFSRQRAATKYILSYKTDEDLADYFMDMYGKDYVNYDECLYYFNGVRWSKDSEDTQLQHIIGQQISPEILAEIEPLYAFIEESGSDINIGKQKKCVREINMRLRNWGSRQGSVKAIMSRIRIPCEKDIWDKNRDLLGFNNGTLEIDTGVFRAGKHEDYISMSTGWDYIPQPEEAVEEFFQSFICKVQPEKEIRDCTLQIISSSLKGQTLENVAIMTGIGRNGKDTVLSVLLKQSLGDYAYIGHKSAICGNHKEGGLNQEMANMHKKRVVIYQEPKKTDTLNCAALKELTGCDEVNARGLYSKKTSTVLHATQILMCNGIPMLDYVDEAFSRRLIVCPWKSQFLNEIQRAKLPADTPYMYDVDMKYKSDAWLATDKQLFVQVLLRYYAKLHKDGYVIRDIPKSMRDLGDRYMSDSDEFFSWFQDNFDEAKDSWVSVADVYDTYRGSDMWHDLTKKERRKMNKTKFTQDLKDSVQLKNYYRETHRPTVDGVRRNLRHVLVMWKVRDNDRGVKYHELN